MATVHNPTDYTLFCLALGRSLEGGETVPVTAELARLVPTGVFVVEGANPIRKSITRGAKKVEVTGSPAAETR